MSQEENGNGNHVTRRITGETRTASTVKTELLVGGGGVVNICKQPRNPCMGDRANSTPYFQRADKWAEE